MATPTIGLLGYTEIDDADTNANWTEATTPDPDILKEGTNSMSGVLNADLDVAYYDDGVTRSIANKHLRMWINTTNMPYMEDDAGNGYEMYVHDGSNTDYYTIFSSDDYSGGWFNAVVDCALFTTVTDANVDRWGIRVNHHTRGKNAVNFWIDYVRYLDGYYITGGTSGDKIKLSDIAIADTGTTTLYGYGIILENEEVYFCYGKFQIGNGSTTTYFEMDGDVLVFTDAPVADGLYSLIGNGSGANITITNSTIKSAGIGDANRFDVDMSTDSPGTVAITDTVFLRGGAVTFASGQTNTGNTFNNCQQITTNGADISECSVVDSAVVTNMGAVYQNVAYTDTYFDGMTFEMGTNSHHAIDFGTAVTSNLTLRNVEFSGFGSTDDANDSIVRFLATSGSLTLSLVNCTVDGSAATTSNFSVDSIAGIAVTLSIDPVTTSVHVNDHNGNDLQNARVFLKAANATGDLPFEETVTIIRSGTTATVSHNGHGLNTNEYVDLNGITNNTWDNWGAHKIIVSDANTYTYTTIDTGSTNYTGTIKATGVTIYGLTDSNGDISSSRTYALNQPLTGYVRKSSSSPYYKPAELNGEVDSSFGLSITVKLILDE